MSILSFKNTVTLSRNSTYSLEPRPDGVNVNGILYIKDTTSLRNISDELIIRGGVGLHMGVGSSPSISVDEAGIVQILVSDVEILKVSPTGTQITGITSSNEFVENGVSLASKYLGINDSAANSLLLAGQNGSYYRNASNLNSGTIPSSIFSDASHGSRSGGAMHSLATTSVAGFMSSTDKVKMDSIASGSTANQNIVAGDGLSGGGSNNTVTLSVGTSVIRTTGNQSIIGSLGSDEYIEGGVSLASKYLGINGIAFDSNLLGGQNSAYYRNANNLNAGTLLAARFNDTSHGTRAGGTLHSLATVTVAGFMSSNDKAKLDGVATGASGNQTIIAGNGLSGGGSTESITLNVDGTVIRTSGDQSISGTLSGSSFIEGGTALVNKYLGITNTSSNSLLLEGQNSAYYRNAGNLNAGTLLGARFTDTSHGDRSGGTLHSVVTGLSNGFMSSSDKLKLDGIATGATVNQTIVAGSGISGGGSGASVSVAVDGTVLRTTGNQSTSGTLTCTSFIEGGVALSSKYLGIAATAANSTKFNNLSSTSFVRSDVDSTLSANLTTATNKYLFFGSASNSRIWNNGTDLYIRSLTNSGKIYLQGTNSSAANVAMIYMDPNSACTLYHAGDQKFITTSTGISITGTITSTGDVIAYASDERLKCDIELIGDSLHKVNQLRGVRYKFNEEGNKHGFGGEAQVGLIAQDVEKVLPELVKPAPFDHDEHGNSISGNNYKTVQYDKLVSLLVESIKELTKRVELLESMQEK